MTDTPPPAPETSERIRPLAEMVHALGFLTRLPIPLARTIDPPPLAQNMRMFGIAGALIGAAIGAVLVSASYLQVPPMMAAVIAVAAGILLTGALHEDGAADLADGLAGGKTRERRLEIMRDSRIGTYGALALGLVLFARIAAYVSLLSLPALTVLAIIAATQAFSRALVVDLMWATPAARIDGLSVFAGRPSRGAAIFAIITGLTVTLLTGLLVQPASGIVALALALAATALLRRLALRRLGGQTGDVCGAVQVAAEIAMLVAFVATIH